MKKITLFSKIQAVSAHESKRVSWASQLSLQALGKGSSMHDRMGPIFSEATFELLYPVLL